MATASTRTGHLAPDDISVGTRYCYVHTERETGLSCTACERPICSGCMVHAPVGQLCKSCAERRKPVQYQLPTDKLFLGAATALVAGFAVALVGWAVLMLLPIFALYALLLLTMPTASLVANVLDRVTRGRRGKRLQLAVGAAMVAGALPMLIVTLTLFWPPDALWDAIFVGIVAYSTMLRLR